MKIRTLSAVTSVKFLESLWDVYINLYTYIYVCGYRNLCYINVLYSTLTYFVFVQIYVSDNLERLE